MSRCAHLPVRSARITTKTSRAGGRPGMRLVEGNPKSRHGAGDCALPRADILRANASPDTDADDQPVLLGFVRQMQVEARCDLQHSD